MKKVITFLLGFIGIFCVVYYASKYYIHLNLNFDNNSILKFTIIVTIILVNLIVGLINYHRLNKCQLQNVMLMEEIKELSNQVKNYHYSEIKSITDNMECILDLENTNKEEK